MSTRRPRPAFDPRVGALALLACGALAARGDETPPGRVVAAFDRPAAVAWVADGDAGAAYVADARGVFALCADRPEPVAGMPAGIAAMIAPGARTLVATGSQSAIWNLDPAASRAAVAADLRVVSSADGGAKPEPFTALALDDRHVFGVGGGGLYRARRVGERLTSFRPFAPSWATGVAAVALGERGYLALLQRDADGAGWRLVFANPNRPTAPVVSWQTPLVSPRSLAYGPGPAPTERRLYALDERGVVRIDAADPRDALAACPVTLVADAPGATALAFGSASALYVTATNDDGGGVLLRFDGAY